MKKLYYLLENKGPEPLTKMLESLTGTLRNTEKANNIDVELYLRRHEGLIYKMNKIDPSLMTEKVHKTHFEIIKSITKSFSDPTDHDYKICVEFMPLLCWATKFHIMAGFAREEKKQSDQIAAD